MSKQGQMPHFSPYMTKEGVVGHLIGAQLCVLCSYVYLINGGKLNGGIAIQWRH